MVLFTNIRIILIITVVLFSIPINLLGQEPLERIQKLLDVDSVQAAKIEIGKQIAILKGEESFIGLADYVYVLGQTEFAENPQTLYSEAKGLSNDIKAQIQDPKILYKVYIHLASLLNDQSKPIVAYAYADSALVEARKSQIPKNLAEAEYYLSEYGFKQGDFSLLMTHNTNGLALLNKYPNEPFPIAPRIYNYKAAILNFSSQLDSADYYFEKAISSLDLTDKSPGNQYYLPATIKGNWVLVKQNQGNFEEAMQLSLEGMHLYHKFLSTTKNHPLSSRVLSNLSIAYRNISALQGTLGNEEMAKHFSRVGYVHARTHFAPGTMEHFTSAILMAETLLYTNGELEEALLFLDEAQGNLDAIGGESYEWKGWVNGLYGDIHYLQEHYDKALEYYTQADAFYEKSTPKKYSRDRLVLLDYMAYSKAKLGHKDEALALSDRILDLAEGGLGRDSPFYAQAQFNRARINYLFENYEEALFWSKRVLEGFNARSEVGKRNRFYFEKNKAGAQLLLVKTKYQLLKGVETGELENLLPLLQEAIYNLEEQRSILSSPEDINSLIEENREVFDFSKQLNLELFKRTGNEKYLEKSITLHESAIYSRIRARLNLKEGTTFSNLPDSVLSREKELRNRLQTRLIEATTSTDSEAIFKSVQEWDSFRAHLELTYPKYFKMRHATLEEPIDALQRNIPENSTIVRYFFTEDQLYALVMDGTSQNLVSLQAGDLQGDIEELAASPYDAQKVGKVVHNLYKKLWGPLEEHIKTMRVIILPDRELFNISFEMLTSSPISNFKELASKSLLAKHTISYNYSLLLLQKNRKTLDFEENFVAFAPEFDTAMKENYQLAVSDSINLDRTYLTLLPQPFSIELAKSFTRRFKGSSFTNQKASKKLFIQNAGEHKIIHIGTHAESNNVSPELSRLVFAKNVKDSLNINDNYLHTYEIYNENLSSQLAILTACETGKPGYQPGEGMISLAHAFNYAGSESILTSLWQIDEQSSTQILEYFYTYLEEGLPKDEALKNAKLDYLANAKGRTLHPQYWAGLILMGDTAPIAISAQSNWWVWVLVGIIFIVFLILFIKKRKTPNSI